jgi:hypothetical protein
MTEGQGVSLGAILAALLAGNVEGARISSR